MAGVAVTLAVAVGEGEGMLGLGVLVGWGSVGAVTITGVGGVVAIAVGVVGEGGSKQAGQARRRMMPRTNSLRPFITQFDKRVLIKPIPNLWAFLNTSFTCLGYKIEVSEPAEGSDKGAFSAQHGGSIYSDRRGR